MNGLKDWIKKQKKSKTQKSIQKPKTLKEHETVDVGRTETISKVLLDGLYDQGSPLYKLKGCPHIMRIIWENVTQFWEEMVDMPVVSDPTASRFHVKVQIDEAGPGSEGGGSSQHFKGHRWGAGCAHYVFSHGSEGGLRVLRGGIYLSSSLQSSCRAWNCSVGHPAIGRLDIEHMREALPGPGEELEAGQLYWLTDRTPHESLPLSKGGYRQFFRLVTSKVSFWNRDHSTPNPLGVRPDPTITLTVVGDKFSMEGVEIESTL